MRIHSVAILLATLTIGWPGAREADASTQGGPHQATGIRIGEVTATSAIVWTRLTARPKREESSWEVPGATGTVKVVWWPRADPIERRETKWRAADPEADYTCQVELEGLSPRTDYGLEVLTRAPGSGEATSRLEGGFRTAPAADRPAPVRFTVVTGQGYHRRDAEDRGHAIYPLMLALDLEGIAISTGSACTTGAMAPSHVLTALGLDSAATQSTVRVAWGRVNDAADLDLATAKLIAAMRTLRAGAARNR